jgi:hypothetical protein
MNATWMLVGVALGAGLGLLATSNPAWVLEHPGTILLAFAALVAVAMLAVHRRMAAFDRGHDARAEALRLALLEQYAPHLLEAEAS